MRDLGRAAPQHRRADIVQMRHGWRESRVTLAEHAHVERLRARRDQQIRDLVLELLRA